MEIITGYTGTPHITSTQDRDANQGTFGTGSYILDVGSKMAATIISANEIRIADGIVSHQGCLGSISSGSYDSVAIANGTQGMQRRDLIVCRYEKDAETNVESLSLVVIEGTPAASSPTTPSYNTGSIQVGDSPVDMPLYRVNISGVSISSVTKIANEIMTQAETDTLLGNTSISGIGGGTLTGAVSALNSKTESSISINNGTALANIVEKTGNYCHVSFRINNMTTITGMSNIATIPEGFRPENGFATILLINYNGTWTAAVGSVYSSGVISVNWGSSAVTDIIADFSYVTNN